MNATLDSLVRQGALRFLHQIDLDENSRSCGIADRSFWAWKIRDYANGTWQGGIAGLLDSRDLLDLSTDEIRSLVSRLALGTATIQRRDGSFEEAYPFESSYAVTGLVLFNWMYAISVHDDCFDIQTRREIEIIALKAVNFLENTPETHGVIANHVATTELALLMARRFLRRPANAAAITALMVSQHPKENWFPEYGGADPGYQLLFNHYFAATHSSQSFSPDILAQLRRSVDFTSKFCLPNGDFAGEIGSRGTAIVYPSGFLKFGESRTIIESGLKSWLEDTHMNSLGSVNPTTVDDGNFVPVFNSWALYRRLAATADFETREWSANSTNFFNDAGLVTARRDNVMVALSIPTGAYRRIVRQEHGLWMDESVVALTQQSASTQLGITRTIEVNINRIVLELFAADRIQSFNSPLSAILLRTISAVVFPFPFLQRATKRLLVAYVMKRKGRIRTTGILLSLDLTSDRLNVEFEGPVREWRAEKYGFHTHMASANTFRQAAL